MKNLTKTITLILIALIIVSPVFAKKRKYDYQPVQIGDFDLALALSKKVMDENGMSIYKFDYANGIIIGQYANFRDIIIKMRAKVQFKYENNLLHIELIEMEQKTKYGWEFNNTVITRAPRKAIFKLAERIKELNSSPEDKNVALDEFFSNLNVHYKFLDNASKLAIKRWVKMHMKGKTFVWDLRFRNVDENTSRDPSLRKYKYVEYFGYGDSGSMSSEFMQELLENFKIKRYTNSDRHVMTRQGSHVRVKGVCIDAHDQTGDISILLLDN